MFRIRSCFSLSNQKKIYKRLVSTTVKLRAPDLKAEIAKKIPQAIEKIREIRKNHGGTKIGEVTVNQLYMGMRGVRALVSETSELDPNEGIRFRGLSIPELENTLPRAPHGQEPLPEGMFWLMTTGEVPTEEQAKWLSKEWAERSVVPGHVVTLLNGLPAEQVHPMAQLSAALNVCSTESKFLKAYEDGLRKHQYWEFVYEDAMDLIAKIPVIAAIIYRNSYKGGGKIGPVDDKFDWAGNFGTMLGFESPEFKDLLRLYLTIHCDHEGGNVSAHTCHLVGSALSDPYLSLAAAMDGLAGPLHGLACQEVLTFLRKIQKEFGDTVTNEQLKGFVEKTLKSGQVIPGYGHAVLRKTDPRYSVQRKFAEKHFPEDKMFLVVKQLFELYGFPWFKKSLLPWDLTMITCNFLLKVVPPVLQGLGKVANPWPNVDAHSGVCIQHYGMTEMAFYTVLFGVSRTLGVMASLIWDRALGLPIERPKSITTPSLEKILLAPKLNKEKRREGSEGVHTTKPPPITANVGNEYIDMKFYI